MGPHDVTFVDGVRIRYYGSPTDLMAKRLIWAQAIDEDVPALRAHLRRGGLLVDVGAYSGLWTLYACAAMPDGTCIAIEPNPVSAANLVRNIALNGMTERVAVATCAVSDVEGSATLRIPADNSRASITETEGQPITVNVRRLDDLLADRADVAAVKIDVEGLEAEVIEGATEVLRRCGLPPLFVEILDAASFDRVRSAAAAVGYTRIRHLRDGQRVEVTEYAGWVNYLVTSDVEGGSGSASIRG